MATFAAAAAAAAVAVHCRRATMWLLFGPVDQKTRGEAPLCLDPP